MNEFEGSWSSRERDGAIRFCLDFQAAPQERRCVLGRNVYSRAIVDRIQIAALGNDVASDREFDGVPIIRAADLPDLHSGCKALLRRCLELICATLMCLVRYREA
jgi:hypothetical protein